jgi:hypothetical protein
MDKLKVDSSDIIYLDNVDANLKAAQGMGMTTIKVRIFSLISFHFEP